MIHGWDWYAERALVSGLAGYSAGIIVRVLRANFGLKNRPLGEALKYTVFSIGILIGFWVMKLWVRRTLDPAMKAMSAVLVVVIMVGMVVAFFQERKRSRREKVMEEINSHTYHYSEEGK